MSEVRKSKSKMDLINEFLDMAVDIDRREEMKAYYKERIAKKDVGKDKAESDIKDDTLMDLAAQFIGQNDGERLTKLLELLDQLDKLDQPETEKKPKEDSFLRNNKMCGTKLDGNLCIDMISNCLFSKDASACITKWNSQDWSKEIDVANMDGELAYELATKIGLVNSSVADLIKAGKIPSLNSSTTAVLNAIRKRI